MGKEWPSILRLFHEELGYKVRAAKQTLGYQLFYIDLAAWKLSLTSLTPVIWVQTKDLDGVSSQHVMESLGDVLRERNLTRQIVLVLIDGNAFPLFRHKTNSNYSLVLIGSDEQKSLLHSRRPTGESARYSLCAGTDLVSIPL